MTQSVDKLSTLFGFLTVVELQNVGHCGGLLIVSHVGRPVEFHCTAPVTRNRAQEIMYGETYLGFLYAEQIGMALVDKARQKPNIFLTNTPDMLPITEMIDQPLLLVENPDASEKFDGRGLNKFEVNDQTLFCVNAKQDELPWVQDSAKAFRTTLPFEEPIERIYSAIEEANQVLRAA